MLSVVVFGAICELGDDDPYTPPVCHDPAPAPDRPQNRAEPEQADNPDGPKRADEAGEPGHPEPDTGQTRRRFRGRFTSHDAVKQTPLRQRRREAQRSRHRNQAHVSFTEFADLSDGRRVIMRSDRGFSWSRWPSSHESDPWVGITREGLADDVRGYLAAEEEDCCPIAPEAVVEHIRRSYDIAVDPTSVQAALQAPRQVEFAARLLQQLQPDPSL